MPRVMFIIGELLCTLRLVNFAGRSLVEPFRFKAIIAVVRRVLVVTVVEQWARLCRTGRGLSPIV